MKTWITIILASVGLLWSSLVFAQPIVRVTNAEDPLAVRKQVLQYLAYFDITEDVYINIIFAKHMPSSLDGITFCPDPVKPLPYQIIKVRIADRLSKRKKRLILAHEMIHVKQYAKGELKVIDDKKVMWKGHIFHNHYSGSTSQLSPWEREAYRNDNLVAQIGRKAVYSPLLAESINWYSIRFSWKKDSTGVNRIQKAIFPTDNTTL